MTRSDGAPTDATSERLVVFVSYSRADRQTADALVAALESHDIAVKIDRRDLPYGEQWQAELTEFIASADAIVWLVSPASIASPWCDWELSEAARLSKRLVPIGIARVDMTALPPHLGRIHLLPAEGLFSIERHLDSLLGALGSDRPWLKSHTRLGERARAWAQAGRPENELLLRGQELEQAQAWLQRAPRPKRGLAPPAQPTELQRAFVAASQAAETASQRERSMREQAARIATGYQFSSRAQLAIEGGCFDRALRLALAGILLSDPDAPAALFEDVVDAARATRLKVEARPAAGVGAAALTPDQSLAAVVDGNGDLSVWDVEAARPIAMLSAAEAPRGGVRSVAIDAAGERIVIGSGENADVVAARTGTRMRTLGPHRGRVLRVGLIDRTALAYTIDAPRTTVVGEQGYFALRLWNIETGAAVLTIDDFASALDTVLVHPSGTWLVTQHWRGESLVWATASGERAGTLAGDGVAGVLSFSRDGGRYLARSNDLLRIDVREWGSNRLLGSLRGHTQTIRHACWSPDATRIATGDAHGVVGLWDAGPGERLGWLLDSARDSTPDEVSALAFTGDGKGLIVASSSAALMTIWNLQDRRVATRVHGHQAPITRIEVSADGGSFCSVAFGEALRVWTLQDVPHASVRAVSLPHPSRAGLRSERVEAPEIEGLDTSFLDRAPGVRVFGPLKPQGALAAVLARGLGDAEAFTDAERSADEQVRNAPRNPFQALRERGPQSEDREP